MDSGLEERILPSIRRSQILLIYRNGGVVNPETYGQIVCSVGRLRMETCGQIVCSVGRLPIRFTVGTGGTIMLVRSCGRRGIADGDLRSDRVHGRETGTIRVAQSVSGVIFC